jgi:ABC-type xylose transport system substrate-binding protein
MRPLTTLLAALLGCTVLTGCVQENPTVVALLASDAAQRFEPRVDVEAFEARVEATCEECAVRVYDAEGDAAAQAAQAEEALADSADVIVLDPVEVEEAEALVGGGEDEVPVVAHTTLVPGADWFVGTADPVGPDGSGPEAGTDLEAARQVVAGERRSMRHVPATAMSEQAADVAVGILAGDEVEGAEDFEGVPSFLHPVTEVRLADLTSVLVREGAVTLEELCSGSTARKCERLGFV